jgi:hypothetical protein
MPADRTRLQALAAEVGGFHLRDRAMLRAQKKIEGLLAAAGEIPAAEAATYVAAVRRYFTGFEREARAHLLDVERRLAKVSQIQFNLSAERSVSARRIEVTQGVLSRLKEMGGA